MTTSMWNLPATLMVLLGLLAVALCQWRCKTSLKIFGLGALIWTVSVAVKAAIAVPLNTPMYELLHHALPKHPADVTFWAYIGLLTGITEVGIFLAMARWFQRRRWSWEDAVSVGVGLGAVEAILMGLGATIAVATGQTDGLTIAPVLERFLAILIHMATAVAAIYAVTRQRWGWYAFAFIQKSGVDAVAAYVLLAGRQTLSSHPWLVELAYFGPFAYIAIPILWWLKQQWTSDQKAASDTAAPKM